MRTMTREEPGGRVVDAGGRVDGRVRVGLEAGRADGTGFLRRERDRNHEPDRPERHARLRDDGAAPVLRERDQDGESRGHEADEREERGEAGVPRGRDRTRGLGDLLIDLEQVSVGRARPKPRQIPGPMRAPWLAMSRPRRCGEVTRTYPSCPPSGR